MYLGSLQGSSVYSSKRPIHIQCSCAETIIYSRHKALSPLLLGAVCVNWSTLITCIPHPLYGTFKACTNNCVHGKLFDQSIDQWVYVSTTVSGSSSSLHTPFGDPRTRCNTVLSNFHCRLWNCQFIVLQTPSCLSPSKSVLFMLQRHCLLFPCSLLLHSHTCMPKSLHQLKSRTPSSKLPQ